MKILLVKPISDIHIVSPPLALLYLASSLKNSNVEVEILDCLLKKYTFEDFKNYLKKNPPDVIGFTSFTLEFKSALKMAKIAKYFNPKTKIVFGGPHVSNVPEESLKNSEIDFIFRSEADEGFPLLIKELQKNNKNPNFKKIPCLGWKNKNKIILNPIKLLENLDSLSFPDFDGVDFLKYPKLYISKKYPYAPIITSRGCPFNCTFCTAKQLSGSKWRFRSAENIIEELKILKKKYNIKEFQIWDDNFTLNKERAKKFCDLLIKEKLNLSWWCPNGVRLETLDRELLMKMKKAGCYAIAFGIESGSEKIQKDMNKNINFKHLRKMVEFSYNLGLRTQGFFIIGYPTETREDILKTIKLAKSLPLMRASISLFQPLFGSEIYNQLKKDGKIPKNYSIENCDYSKASVLPIGFKSIEEVKKLQQRAMIEFYIRPKIFFNFIRENLSMSQITEILLMVKKYIFNK
ncbi:MAG: radical SAM protein [archaeon]|nr:radical SAM protein [archaeon]